MEPDNAGALRTGGANNRHSPTVFFPKGGRHVTKTLDAEFELNRKLPPLDVEHRLVLRAGRPTLRQLAAGACPLRTARMNRNVMDRHPEGSENSLAQVLAGLEARLSRQLTMDRETIVGAIAGGPLSAGGASGGRGGACPIVLMPDDPPPCNSCGRIFADPLRMAIHQRGCARL